jgi:hypothetical protein
VSVGPHRQRLYKAVPNPTDLARYRFLEALDSGGKPHCRACATTASPSLPLLLTLTYATPLDFTAIVGSEVMVASTSLSKKEGMSWLRSKPIVCKNPTGSRTLDDP